MPTKPQGTDRQEEGEQGLLLPIAKDTPTSLQSTEKTSDVLSTKRIKNQFPDSIQLRSGVYDILWVVSFRVFTIFIIASCLVLGGKKQVFGLRDQNVNVSVVSVVFDLPVDAQLAVFGLVNKILDYLVEDALFHVCGVTLTTWMAFTKIGARTIDFQMQDELTKPWITVMNFVQRFKLSGWQGIGLSGLLRYIASFATAISVLLLGASINTIGIPKERWTAGTNLWTDRSFIRSVKWGGVDNIAYNMGFSVEGIQNRSNSIMASQCWLVTSGLWLATKNDGWVQVYQDRNGAWNDLSNSRTDVMKITGIRIYDSMVSSLSIQGNAIYDLWISQISNGSSDARSSLGWSGGFNLTLPIGTTSCVESTTSLAEETIAVLGPDVQGPVEMKIIFGNSSAKSFPGATCTFTLQQGQYPVHSWIISENRPDFSIDNYSNDRYLNVTFQEPRAENRNMVVKVADIFREIIPTMDDLSRPDGLVKHILSVRDNLHRIGLSSPDSPVGLALAAVVAGMVQHVFTMAEWELVGVDPGKDLVRSVNVRYQVYGSGPRLTWEWAIATVMAIILLLLIYDLFITLRQMINVGPWLSLAGMMIAANDAQRMASIEGSRGAENETTQKTMYFIRKPCSGNPKLTDDPDSGFVLSKDDWFGGDEDHDKGTHESNDSAVDR